jgi:transposase
MLARDSESRHAVGAEHEIPDIAGYSGGEAGFFQVWSVRAKKILARGRGFYIGRIGYQQREIISRRDPAARPVLEGAGEVTAPAPAAPRVQAGSGLRERLAHARGLNEGRPVPTGTGALPVVPGVPPEAMAVLYPLLASGRASAAAVGLRLGVSKTTAHGYLAAMREYGFAEVAGGGRSSGWQLRERPGTQAQMQDRVGQYVVASQYTTLEDLAQAAHDGLGDADDDARHVLEKVRRIAGAANRAWLRNRGITAVIPVKEDQKKHRRNRGRAGGRPPAFHAARYKERNTVERSFSKLKQFRAVATRYDKRDYMYQATLDVASIRIWLRDPVPDLRDTP